MKTSPKVKICGLKRQKDLLCAKTLGADYFGFILYEKSPRHISLEALKLINDVIPLDTCVFVDVMPTADKIKSMQDFGCKEWILAGGLTPNNIQDALEASCASFIDVNSGVEEAPGIKSEEALRQLFKAVI